RGFLSLSPNWAGTEAFLAYEGSHSDGPFLSPLDYRRDNLTSNLTRRFSDHRSLGFRTNVARNSFRSSGQLPLDEVAAGRLDRFGFVDPSGGGRVRSATGSVYFRQEGAGGQVWRLDGFAARSLFDLYSNFTFFLNDPGRGDAFQQHDSRLQHGTNAQYLRPQSRATWQGLFTAGANYHDNQILVGLYPAVDRIPLGVTSRADVRVTNGAGYVQENVSLFHGRLQAGGGLRFDEFRFDVRGRVQPDASGLEHSGRWEPKASVAFTPSRRVPLTLHANYGRGISTSDARAVVQHSGGARIATTDFYQAGASAHFSRFSLSADAFWIDRSNERVYIPDDGSFEFKGPSRAYGLEGKGSVQITRHLALNASLTQVVNAFYRGTLPRLYVDSAPHFVADAGLTLSGWKGWSGSLRMRAINHYRLDGADPTIRAAGHTVFDLGLTRRIRRGVEFNLALDNLANRAYYETQNYFQSRLPGGLPVARIHGTPGYPITAMAGLTFRLGK
ncbi:MAG: TonB-dependent receptor, partial [Candidatus Solibacter usitatus]|nr:TonB-dependent receptor [Candidatus Solibacter usitatus]